MASVFAPEDIGLDRCAVPFLRAFFFFFEDVSAGFTTAADSGGPPLRVTLFWGILKDLCLHTRPASFVNRRSADCLT